MKMLVDLMPDRLYRQYDVFKGNILLVMNMQSVLEEKITWYPRSSSDT